MTLTAVLLTVSLTGCFAGGGHAAGSGNGERRIKLAMLQPPRSGLSPLSDDAFKLSRWKTAETLVELDRLGEAQPALATEWLQVDRTSWRFVLRDSVEFHDGTAMTPVEVAASLTAAAQGSPKPRILDGVELTARAEGSNAVIITTAAPDPLLPQRLSSPQLAILAASAYKDGGVVSPVNAGTGPYRLVSVEGTSSARLDRFDAYWGAQAEADGVDVQFVPDGTARAAALRTGDADVVGGGRFEYR